MPVRPPKIDRYLAGERSLQPIVEKAERISALSKLCEEALPRELAQQTRAANLKNGTLVLLAANPATAAKLKLLAETLRSFLLLQGKEVNSVSVRVQPTASRAPAVIAAHKQARLSPSALAELSALHDRLPDSPARQALGALLARHDTPPRDSEPAGRVASKGGRRSRRR